jgi:hypothetical protein
LKKNPDAASIGCCVRKIFKKLREPSTEAAMGIEMCAPGLRSLHTYLLDAGMGRVLVHNQGHVIHFHGTEQAGAI